MPFNNNQYFYAALYVTEALPGAKAFTDEICTKYKMTYIPMDAPLRNPAEFCPSADRARVRQLADIGITREECGTFFDALFFSLVNDKKKLVNKNDANAVFFELCADDDHLELNCPHIAQALDVAKLPRSILSPGHLADLHGTGQLFLTNNVNVTDFPYPGRPENPCKTVTQLRYEDLNNGKMLSFVYLHRIVQGEIGKEYTLCYELANGTMQTHKKTCRDGDIIAVFQAETPVDLKTLTDEEVVAGLPSLYPASIAKASTYVPGFVSPLSKEITEETDDPRIMHIVSPPHKFADVDEPMRFGFGHAFYEVKPGDLLYSSGPGQLVRVVRKEQLDKGVVKLRPADQGFFSRQAKHGLQ
jgi:hypothetical protein